MKTLIAPVLSERTYSLFQAVAMGWDIRRGLWSEPELELLEPGLRAGETAIDIGANFGLYAYHLARIVGPSGNVICFEPIPFTARTFRLIHRGLGFGPQVKLIAKGASDKSGKATFTLPVMSYGAISAGIVHMGRNDDRPGNARPFTGETRQVECDVVAVDDALPDARNIALVKCDIEGADLFAMRGMRKILEREHPTVIIEINPWYLAGFGLSVDDVMSFFERLGYACYRYADKTLTRVSAAEIVEDNWVFIHPTRQDRFASLLAA